MSKTISAELKAHMAQETTSIVTCFRIERTDAQEFFFTEHDTDLPIDGDTYEADSGMITTGLSQDRGLGVDNMETVAFLESDKIIEAEVNAGLFDMATVDIFQVNWNDLTQGKLYLCQGWTIGNIEVRDQAFAAELRGKAQKLNQNIIEVYSPDCRATLGDTRCGIDVTDSAYTHEGTVSAVTDNQTFTVTGLSVPSDDTDVFRYGKLTWSTPDSAEYDGLNAGLEMEVKSYDSDTGAMVLFLAMPYAVNIDDEFEVTYGCDKDYLTCNSRFSNILNFRGEPWIPDAGSIPVTKSRDRGTRGMWGRRGL